MRNCLLFTLFAVLLDSMAFATLLLGMKGEAAANRRQWSEAEALSGSRLRC